MNQDSLRPKVSAPRQATPPPAPAAAATSAPAAYQPALGAPPCCATRALPTHPPCVPVFLCSACAHARVAWLAVRCVLVSAGDARGTAHPPVCKLADAARPCRQPISHAQLAGASRREAACPTFFLPQRGSRSPFWSQAAHMRGRARMPQLIIVGIVALP